MTHFKRKVQLSGFSAYLDGSPSQLIQISGFLLYRLFRKVCPELQLCSAESRTVHLSSSCTSWVSRPQKSVTLPQCPGGRTAKCTRTCGGGIGQQQKIDKYDSVGTYIKESKFVLRLMFLCFTLKQRFNDYRL